MASPTPPARKRSTFTSGVVVGVLMLLAAVVALVSILVLREDDAATVVATPSPSPSSSPSPSLSPSPSPSRVATPRQVEQTFHEQAWLKGERLWMASGDFPLADEDCAVHAFTENEVTLGAYQTDCQSWQTDGYDIIIFSVALRNPTTRALTFNLRNFVLTARDSRTFGPVNVRARAEFPPNFLPETGKLPPKSNLVEYLTFDGRVTGLVPARLTYLDGQQTLTIEFEGHHSIA